MLLSTQATTGIVNVVVRLATLHPLLQAARLSPEQPTGCHGIKVLLEQEKLISDVKAVLLAQLKPLLTCVCKSSGDCDCDCSCVVDMVQRTDGSNWSPETPDEVPMMCRENFPAVFEPGWPPSQDAARPGGGDKGAVAQAPQQGAAAVLTETDAETETAAPLATHDEAPPIIRIISVTSADVALAAVTDEAAAAAADTAEQHQHQHQHQPSLELCLTFADSVDVQQPGFADKLGGVPAEHVESHFTIVDCHAPAPLDESFLDKSVDRSVDFSVSVVRHAPADSSTLRINKYEGARARACL